MRSPLRLNITRIVNKRATKVSGTDARNKAGPIPLLSLGAQKHEARQHSRKKRHAQVEEHALGNLADSNVDRAPLQAEPRWEAR